MSITAERKHGTDPTHARSEGDTGSAEVQVAILSERIANLTEHFKTHKKDNHSRRGLLSGFPAPPLLDHLKKSDEGRYQALIETWACAAKLISEPGRDKPPAGRPPLDRLGRMPRARVNAGTRLARRFAIVTPRARTAILIRLSNWRGSRTRPKSRPPPVRPRWECGPRDAEKEHTMFDIRRKYHRLGRPQADPGNRPHRPPGRRRGPRHLRRDHGPGHRRVRQGAQARPRFLPADRQLPGKDLRRRQDPRRLLQARRPSVREGDPGLPPDRPPDPPAVRQGLQARDPGRRHRALPRPGERSRHRRHGRRLRRPDPLGRALHGPDRRRPRRLHQRRVRAEPDARRRCQGPASSTWSSPAPRTR